MGIAEEDLSLRTAKAVSLLCKILFTPFPVIDFLKADPFSGSTTNILPPSFSSDERLVIIFEKFADELAPLDSLLPDNIFKSSNVNPLFEEKDKDVEIKSFSFPTLTSPEESELILEEIEEKDSIPPGVNLNLPPTFEFSSSNPTSLTLTGEKDHSWKMSMFFSLVRFVWRMMTRIAIRKKIICLLAKFLNKKPKPLSHPQEVDDIKMKDDKVSSQIPIVPLLWPI
ncbi:hypothetical protein Tco_0453065 [Tanacetum coccineum]